MKKILQKFKDFMNKEVQFENESSSFYIMMRWYYFVTAIYIFIFSIIAVVTDLWKNMPIIFIWLPLHIASFFTTYKFKKRVVFHIFSVGILTWFIIAECLMGWDYGAQYFLYPLLVVSFFATQNNYIGKFLYTSFICLLHMLAYFYTSNHEPIIVLEPSIKLIIAILHMLTLFISIFVVCTMFSNTEQEALERLAEYNKRLKREAETDALTGLLNRRSMYKALDKAAEVMQDKTYTVVMGDIDFFKKINDTKGHECGDVVLKIIANYFKGYMTNYGEVSRWGGEEFLFVFKGNSEKTYMLVEEMRKHIEEMEIMYNEERVNVTMTFGMGECDTTLTTTQLIKRVDDRLYEGKQAGRNRVIIQG